MIAAVAEEGLRHEGGQEGNVPVGLAHLHLPQLHLNGLQIENSKVAASEQDLVPRTGDCRGCCGI